VFAAAGAHIGGPKPGVETLEQDGLGLFEAKALCPQSQKALRLPSDFSGLIAVVGVREDRGDRWPFRVGAGECRGSRVVRLFFVLHWRSSLLMLIICCAIPVASGFHDSLDGCDDLRAETNCSVQCLRPQHCNEFGSRLTFEAIYAPIWNPELSISFSDEVSNKVTMDNVLDRVRFTCATRGEVSRELEFIASHFDDFLEPEMS
jgi:hypothetical protein